MDNSVLDIEISCFANYSTSENPKSVNMLKWLRSSKYAEKVKQIRQVSDKEQRDTIKATLPAITPSGIFTYRASDKLVQHSGLIQFDIDYKDHRHVSNFADLKQHISHIDNVAYVGLSVSGKGYWGLVPISCPDKHKQHFRALHKAFKSLGLNIDTAPQNVASLRGYSYDPDGYFNYDAKVFEQMDKPAKKVNGQNVHQPVVNADRYGQAAFSDEINTLSRTPEGNRNHQLFKSTAALASLVAGGVLNRQEVEQALYNTAESIGLKRAEIRATIQSGFRTGLQSPRIPEPKPGYTGRGYHAPDGDRASNGKYKSRNSGNPSKIPNNSNYRVELTPEGYPASWDDPTIKAAYQLQKLKQRDPVVRSLVDMFNGEVVPGSVLNTNRHKY